MSYFESMMPMKQTRTIADQARKYVAIVGVKEAKRSNHYLTAERHCTCGTCFCCEVFHAVHTAILKGEPQ